MDSTDKTHIISNFVLPDKLIQFFTAWTNSNSSSSSSGAPAALRALFRTDDAFRVLLWAGLCAGLCAARGCFPGMKTCRVMPRFRPRAAMRGCH